MGPDQRGLIQGLIKVRLREDIPGEQLARECGWTQSKVSKIETGRTRPSVTDVEAWLDKTNVVGDERKELLALADRVATDVARWPDVNRNGFAHQQRARHERETDAAEISIYQSKVVPGLFHTREYARCMFLSLGQSPDGIDDAVAARLERQDVLYVPSKTIKGVIVERVLRWRPGGAPVAVNLAQLDHLRAIAALPNVEIGIVSDRAQETARSAEPFVLKRGEDYADVQVEILTRELTMNDADDVEKYAAMFAYQESIAVYGQEADELIRRNIAYLQQLL